MNFILTENLTQLNDRIYYEVDTLEVDTDDDDDAELEVDTLKRNTLTVSIR